MTLTLSRNDSDVKPGGALDFALATEPDKWMLT
jgi:hypothetical protein